MILHYISTALANFRKSPFTTAANILTLALGLACFIAAFGIVAYWQSADTRHPDAERLFVVAQGSEQSAGEGSASLVTLSSAPLARYLPLDAPEVEEVARAMPRGEMAVAAGETRLMLYVGGIDPSFLDLFPFEFVAGDASRALEAPNGVVLTQDAARRLFGEASPLGQSVRFNGTQDGVVTGVIAPVHQPSFMGDGARAAFRFDVLTPWAASSMAAMLESDNGWTYSSIFTFAKSREGVSAETLNSRLHALVSRRVPEEVRNLTGLYFRAAPVGQMRTMTLDNMLFSQNATNFSVVGSLLALGALTLLVAGINYANLATAQAAARRGETGLRKALGAEPAQIMIQSWTESLLLVVGAFFLALATLAVAAPVLNIAADVEILAFLQQGYSPLLWLAVLVIVVTLAAGAYPALALSRVRPSAALGGGRSKSGPRLVARVLVGVQFATASFLLIMVTVMQIQRAHLEQTAFGAREDPLIVLNGMRGLGLDYDTLRAQLADEPSIESMTLVEWLPWSDARRVSELTRSPDAGGSAASVYLTSVDYDYFETYRIPLIAGRVFQPDREAVAIDLYTADPATPLPAVIDRVYAERLGFNSPEAAIGETIYLAEDQAASLGRPTQPVRIIGVSEANPVRLKAAESQGNVYIYAPKPNWSQQVPIIRVAREDVAGAMAAINEAWDQMSPDAPANIRFMDELFETSYREFARIGQLFIVLASTAFIIASTGLLGIAVHVAARRRHEIAVRKTLGSTTWGAVRLLLADFSKPVIVANLIAWPLGYLAAETYLSAFAHRIELSVWPFALSMLITLVIAWLAVGGQTYRAASVRPAQVLRDA